MGRGRAGVRSRGLGTAPAKMLAGVDLCIGADLVRGRCWGRVAESTITGPHPCHCFLVQLVDFCLRENFIAGDCALASADQLLCESFGAAISRALPIDRYF